MIGKTSTFFLVQRLWTVTYVLLSCNPSTIVVDSVIVDNGATQEGAAMVKVIVGFSSDEERAAFQREMNEDRSSSTVQNLQAFQRTSAIALTISEAELESLADKFAYIEPDLEIQQYQLPNEEEVLPYGIAAVMQVETLADVISGSNIPLPPPLTADAAATNDCFRVCVIDSGLIVAHIDMPFERTSEDFRINGAEFGIPNNQFWYNPDPSTSVHGTHVTGTIFAEGGNDIGVVGVVPNPQGMCLSIARVFQDGPDDSTTTSDVDMAMEWCADQGARVINMSLGRVGNPDQTTQDIVNSLYDDGVLIVAAAGNAQSTQKSYPASYDNVISVAAVDEELNHATFSQQNDAVDLSAPGVTVLSTVGTDFDMFVMSDFDILLLNALNARRMQFSTVIDSSNDNIVQDALEIVDCQFAFSVCAGVQDKACLISRGTSTFAEKATNCQEGGGAIALIYNNVAGDFSGTLGEAGIVDIPVLELTDGEGETLLDLIQQNPLLVRIVQGDFNYAFFSGTSMASPHVAGVAARIWAARPECTNAQVEEALIMTALDLVAPPFFGNTEGRDDFFGHGLVQAQDAYNYLLGLEAPCGLGPTDAPVPTTEPPSGVPSLSPSDPPSGVPSLSPSGVPSLSPSGVPSLSPTGSPSGVPSMSPSWLPSTSPSKDPTMSPIQQQPTDSPTNSCTDLFDDCASDAQCCSGLCRPFGAVNGPLKCRSQSKVTKNKIGGENRGGAAGGGGRRVLRGAVKTRAAAIPEIGDHDDNKSNSEMRTNHKRDCFVSR